MTAAHGDDELALGRALDAGEPLLRGIVHWMQEGVVLHDPDGTMVEANPTAFALLGREEGQLLGDDGTDPGWDLLDADGRPLPVGRHPAAVARRTGEPARGRIGLRRPDGGRVWLEVSAVPLPVEGGGVPSVVGTFVDVTPLVEVEARLRESEQRFRLALHHAPIGMAIVALDGTYTVVNQRLAEMFGTTPDELVGRTFQELTHPDDVDRDVALARSLVEGRVDHYRTEKRYLRLDGEVLWVRLAVALVRDARGEPLHFVAQIEDISAVRRTMEQLEERALEDPLTGLANRALTTDRVQQATARNRREGRSLAVLCCGIDGLRLVNDSLGHAAGDALVATVGQRIVEVVGDADRVGRGDGDEFFVLIEGLDPAEVPAATIERVVDAVAAPVELLGRELRPTVAIGVALDDGEAADDLLHDAATALSEAKGRGRGEWALFEGRIRDRAVERLRIENDLVAAVERGELELHYQPIVDLETDELVSLEALARWRHPRLGLLSADRFIPVAEDSGLIDELGLHLFDQACGFLARHPGTPLQVFVNVSPSQLARGDFPAGAAAALSRHGVDPSGLGVELTESSVLHATGSSYRALHQLADLGIDLVLDDFGTGYSAIAALLASPIQGIKLDRTFTGRVGLDPQADLVTRALAGMVDALGFRGVAEGVETPDQREAVKAHGWRLGQGWLFGRPVPEHELALPGST